MGRLAALTEGWTPLIVLGVLVIMGALGMALRGRRSSREGDAFDGMSEVEDDGGEESGPRELRDFADVLQRYVVPQRAAHPDWDRLDGAVGVPGRPLVSFDRGGTRYAINGETRFSPLVAAVEWTAGHPGEDPLEIAPGGAVGRLRLRSEVWPAAKDVRIETI